MGIGRVLGAAAPIAAGYFGGPALAGTFGATGGAIAAGALTGAGIAALSGGDILSGGVMGGLGGFSGGELAGAVGKAGTAATTAEANKIAAERTLANAGVPTNAGLTGPTGQFGANMGQVITPGQVGTSSIANPLGGASPVGRSLTAPNIVTPGASPGGTLNALNAPNFNPIQPGNITPGIGDVAREFGGGSEAMGYGKMGLAGLGVAGGAGAFDVEPVDIGPREEEKYDPTRRLNLGMDTGIDQALRRDTGLRLLAQGGEVKKFATGGIYGMTPPAPPPEYGIIDVGGKFVKTSDKPGPGLISDSAYKEQYVTTTAQKNEQGGGGGGGMDPNLSPGGEEAGDKMNPGAISALAAGFAQQQMNPPTKSQTLGLASLAEGGYLETGGEVGDGMSDEIEATIEGTQEARLSDGEFVIPADVVSHLGNGSSDAGARRLYEMMDKVRMARTGTKKQGKEIKPERFMPA